MPPKHLIFALLFLSLFCFHLGLSSHFNKDTDVNPNKEQPQQQESSTHQFLKSLHNQLLDLESKFNNKISEIREKLIPESKESLDTESNQNLTGKLLNDTQTKPLNFAVWYSTSSTYNNGTHNVKERVEIINPEMNLVADRVPGKEEFEVKVQKEGNKEATTQRIPANELRGHLDQVYGDLQNRARDEFSRLGLPFGRSVGSLFGSPDLPLLGASSRLSIEGEGRVEGNVEGENGTVESWPKGNDFFMEEIRNIEREMDFMRKRMDEEMKRVFAF